MAYTAIDDPSAYFQTAIYSGTGSQQSITNGGNSDLQPDWLWIKERNGTSSHQLVDSVRGFHLRVESNNDSADLDAGQAGATNQNVTSFDSDGFGVKNGGAVNESSKTYVAWQWKAGTSFTNDASSTSIGTIDSAGSASDISGFSIVSFTGTGSNGTIKHGLSTAPNLFIIKRRDDDNDWRTGSSALTNFVKHINLNTNATESDLAAAFNSTGPTSSVFSVGTSPSTNASGGTYIAYCFSNIKGYSKVGSFVSNDTVDNTFVYCGFKPALLIAKSTTSTNDWVILDNKRDTFNVAQHKSYPNANDAEATSENDFDFLSNGFKLRNRYGANTFIFMAFAEQPFVTSTGVPATAR